MCATLVVGNCVNLVHDYGFDIAQNGPAALRREQDVERFGSRDQDVRRMLQHRPALVHERVAGADRGANLGHEQATLARHL